MMLGQKQVVGAENVVLQLTAFASFHHQLVNRFQLSVDEEPHFLGFDVGHVHRASVLEVLKGLRDKESEHF